MTDNLKSVLIADDDPPTRILLRAAITQWGYHVIEAKDGEEAWNLMQSPDAPRLLILDWLMPKLDGVALCEKIKKELSADVFIILLTQLTGSTNVVKGFEAGANEFLSKPFNMAELRSRLTIGAKMIQYQRIVKQNLIEMNLIESKINILSQAVDKLLSTKECDELQLNQMKQDIDLVREALNRSKSVL